MVWATVILACLIAALIWWLHKQPDNFPPGPTGLPFLGYFPFLGKYPHIKAAQLSLKYGGVVSLPIGIRRPCIVINDWKAMKEALVNQSEVFSGRPQNFISDQVFQNRNIVFTQGNLWKEKRRFALHHLRDLGFGKTSTEDIIGKEVAELLEQLDASAGQKVSITDLLFMPILNIIWGIVAGRRYSMDDEKMIKFSQTLKGLFECFQASIPVNAIPVLRFIVPSCYKNYNDMMTYSIEIERFLKMEIDDHVQTYSKDIERDFIDIYLAEIYRRQESSEVSPSFQEDQLLGTIKDFFSAGVETTLHTLSWGFLYIATWPEIQVKLQKELDEVIGRGRSPVYSDRTLLMYVEAVLLEVHRYSTIVPTSVPHSNHKTTELMGYTLPKGTFVLQNIWAVHNDPKYWDSPEIFRPERFLNSEGKVEKPEYLIPFSTGSRMCLGESLARMELFLFFATVVQRYSISLPTGEKPPSFEPTPSVTMRPEPFKLVFKNRFGL